MSIALVFSLLSANFDCLDQATRFFRELLILSMPYWSSVSLTLVYILYHQPTDGSYTCCQVGLGDLTRIC